MSMDELAVMDGGKCLLQVRGVRPFLSKKYDITQHPNYKYLSDFNPKNTFDIEKYLSTRLRVRPDDLFLNYEISPSELAEESADDTEYPRERAITILYPSESSGTVPMKP